MNFFDIFKDSEDYPKNIAERGVPEGMLYQYVSNSFLDGLINYTEPFWGCIIERYTKFEDMSAERWREITCCASPLKNFGDDILILSETLNSLWFFWYDQDNSGCSIGRVAKKFLRKSFMQELLTRWVASQRKEPTSMTGRFVELPEGWLDTGWVTF